MSGMTRRDWLLASACWAEVLRAQTSAPRFTYFDAATAAEVEAIAETIMPGDATPGAKEAGVIWFIDGALAGHDKDERPLYVKGLAETQARRTALFPGSSSIAALSSTQRIALLKDIEQTDFFRVVRLHTVLGFFGDPRYGGNRNGAGAKLLGRTEAMHYSPPFGYYDAEATK
jgi:gluconate 2-dehydrogenase gamma chain